MSVTLGSAEHWDAAYRDGDTSRSWFQDYPVQSLRMLDAAGVTVADSVIDVGGGASRLVDALIARGHTDITVLDISATGLRCAQQRLGPAAEQVQWLVADLITWRPERAYRVWHDRAVLHFLTVDSARRRYLRALDDATTSGAVAVLATFAAGGPRQCSGLPVARYGANDLAAVLGQRWLPIGQARERHNTPSGAVQPFTWAAFRRH